MLAYYSILIALAAIGKPASGAAASLSIAYTRFIGWSKQQKHDK